MDMDDADENTPSLSEDSSQSSLLSDTSSALSSPEPSPPPPPTKPQPEPPQKPLTRRQRKALGLPHPRAVAQAQVQVKASTRSAGKIILPGGRRVLRSAGKVTVPGGMGGTVGPESEWQANGTGRLDVRGFRELKI
jgi:hypothetical protein